MADVTVKTSKLFSIDWADAAKGLLMAVISPVFTTLITSLNAGEFNINWKAIGIVATVSALSYLSKNFFTPSQTIVKIAPPITDAGVEEVKQTLQDAPKQ